MKYHKLPKREKLKELYETKSTSEIAKIYGATQRAVSTKLKRAGVKIRGLKEGQLFVSNRIKLSKQLKELIEGNLLGDGSINYAPSKKSFCYRHSEKNKQYLCFLINQFRKIGVKCLGIYKDNRKYYHFSTRYYRDFSFFREKWYPKGKRTIPTNLKITPLMLRYWYLRDGSYDKKSISEKVVICNDFKTGNRKVLERELTRLGVKYSVYKNCFYIKKASRKRFFKLILPPEKEMPKCYLYKFPEDTKCH